MAVLEQLAQQMAAEVTDRVGRSWRWRVAVLVTLAGSVVVLAGALASLLR
jgi:hypothetical protein